MRYKNYKKATKTLTSFIIVAYLYIIALKTVTIARGTEHGKGEGQVVSGRRANEPITAQIVGVECREVWRL